MVESTSKPRKPRHGTVRRYKDGCRCDPCTEANTKARRRERDLAAKRSGKPVPTTPRRVPTGGANGPTGPRRSGHDDELVRIIEDALFEGHGALTAAAVAADRIRAAHYRVVIDAPVEAATRRALAAVGGTSDIAAMRREVAYRAAAVMDDADAARYFKGAAEVLRTEAADLIALAPPKDGEADELTQLLGSFGSRGNAGGGAPVGDAEEPE